MFNHCRDIRASCKCRKDKIGIANFQIGAIFINKLQIWVLNNYIVAKFIFHDTITVIFIQFRGFLGNDVSQEQTRTDKNTIEKRVKI